MVMRTKLSLLIGLAILLSLSLSTIDFTVNKNSSQVLYARVPTNTIATAKSMGDLRYWNYDVVLIDFSEYENRIKSEMARIEKEVEALAYNPNLIKELAKQYNVDEKTLKEIFSPNNIYTKIYEHKYNEPLGISPTRDTRAIKPDKFAKYPSKWAVHNQLAPTTEIDSQPHPWTREPETLMPLYYISQDDMMLKNWVVYFNSSANNITNRAYSYCKKIVLGKRPLLHPKYGFIIRNSRGDEVLVDEQPTRKLNRKQQTSYVVKQERPQDKRLNPNYNWKKPKYDYGVYQQTVRRLGMTVLGARIHFPRWKHNATAIIRPLFDIIAYDHLGNLVNLGNGVLDNVGKIRYITAEVSGRKFPHSLAVRLRDQYDNVREYFLGYLNFAGWRRLKWTNSLYFPEVDRPLYLKSVPLYPNERPHVKFDSFVVRKYADGPGGDFVVYFKDVKMAFDFAIPPEDRTEIDDEAYWGILKAVHFKRRLQQLVRARDYLERIREERARKGQNLYWGQHPINFR